MVLLEDVGQTHVYLGDHLKIWADRYGFRSEQKFGSVVLRPKKIVVTSNYHPSELWTDKSVLDPILRRFKLIHYPESYKDRIAREANEVRRDLLQAMRNVQKEIDEKEKEDDDRCLICYLDPCNCCLSQ